MIIFGNLVTVIIKPDFIFNNFLYSICEITNYIWIWMKLCYAVMQSFSVCWQYGFRSLYLYPSAGTGVSDCLMRKHNVDHIYKVRACLCQPGCTAALFTPVDPFQFRGERRVPSGGRSVTLWCVTGACVTQWQCDTGRSRPNTGQE